MTTTIQFHLVNNTEMMLDAVWLRVDDSYYLAQKLAAHGDIAHLMSLCRCGITIGALPMISST